MAETTKAWGATLGVIFGLRIVEVKAALELVLLLVTIAFTIFQWVRASKK